MAQNGLVCGGKFDNFKNILSENIWYRFKLT